MPIVVVIMISIGYYSLYTYNGILTLTVMAGSESFGNKTFEAVRNVASAEISNEQIINVASSFQVAGRISAINSEIESSGKQEFLQTYSNESINHLWTYGGVPGITSVGHKDIVAQAGISTIHIDSKKIIDQKQFVNPENVAEKQRLREYAVISNLSYSKFKTIDGELGVGDVELDPLSFPNMLRLFDKKKPSQLSSEEEFIYEYIHNSKNEADIDFNDKFTVTADIENIFRLHDIGTEDKHYADLKPEQRSVMNDMEKSVLLPKVSNLERRLLAQSLKAIKKRKIVENGETLKGLKDKYIVKDYFPNNTDTDNSSFGAVCLIDKKSGMKTFAMRGTNVKEFGDLTSDAALAFNNVPEKQTTDMINFIERNITKGEPFKITGHSLGGALSQIATAMYRENVTETYTFNSPGARKLKIDPKWESGSERGLLFEKFTKFKYNKGRLETGKGIINVKGDAGQKTFANAGEDIGEYEINFKDLASHSIDTMIKYIDTEATMNEFTRKKNNNKPYAKDNLND